MISKKVEKKIYFYKIDAGQNAAGMPNPFNPSSVLKQIDGLPFSNSPTGRYWDNNPDSITCCWIDKESYNHRLRFGYIRRTGLPQIERGGNISPLGIPTDAGLIEQVHVVFFPNEIVGSEFNFHMEWSI